MPTLDALGALVADDDGGGAQKKGAARLLELVEGHGCYPFRDDVNDAHLAVPVPPGGTRTMPVRSRACKSFLGWLLWSADGKAASTAALDGAVNVLEGRALHSSDAPQHPLAVRAAEHGGVLWFDLGRDDWLAARVTADGVSLRPAPVLFRRFGHMKSADVPLPLGAEGAAYRLRDYLNLADDTQWNLLLPWLVAALVPDIPHPILVLHGPAGSAKTTAMRLLRRCIDPSASEVLTLPHDLAQLVQVLHHNYCAPFDNLSHLTAEHSDALCRAVTGDGFSKRMLFTDADDVIMTFRRVVVLSGVNVVAQKPDLLDRSILLGLRPIPKARRREEKALLAEFDADAPAIRAGLLEALSAAMAIYPGVKLPELPRMADFARWGYAAAEALGIGGDGFLGAYAANITRQTDEAVSAHVVGRVLLPLLDEHGGFCGTPKELREALNAKAEALGVDTRDRAWPRADHALRRRIMEIHHNLAAEGWACDLPARARHDRPATWTIQRVDEGREKGAEEAEGAEPLRDRHSSAAPSATEGAEEAGEGAEGAGAADGSAPSAAPSAPTLSEEAELGFSIDGHSAPSAPSAPFARPSSTGGSADPLPTPPCPACGGRDWWTTRAGDRRCRVCHPPASPAVAAPDDDEETL